MEDAHAFVYDYGGVHGQGFFGIFDGHAGKDAAEWCGQNFHQVSKHLPADAQARDPGITQNPTVACKNSIFSRHSR